MAWMAFDVVLMDLIYQPVEESLQMLYCFRSQSQFLKIPMIFADVEVILILDLKFSTEVVI